MAVNVKLVYSMHESRAMAVHATFSLIRQIFGWDLLTIISNKKQKQKRFEIDTKLAFAVVEPCIDLVWWVLVCAYMCVCQCLCMCVFSGLMHKLFSAFNLYVLISWVPAHHCVRCETTGANSSRHYKHVLTSLKLNSNNCQTSRLTWCSMDLCHRKVFALSVSVSISCLSDSPHPTPPHFLFAEKCRRFLPPSLASAFFFISAPVDLVLI